MSDSSSRRELRIRAAVSKKLTTLCYNDTELSVTDGRFPFSSQKCARNLCGTGRLVQVPLRQVLAARRDGLIVEVAYIGRKKKEPMFLTTLVGTVEQAEENVLDAWLETLLHLAYEDMGVKRGRRVKVIINPHSGTKKGVATFNKTIEPILRSARCTLDVSHTTRGGHAYEIAKTLSLDYDAIVIVSGDGLVHEVLNGFAHHEQPLNAFRIPLAPIPTGSGNGLAINLLGMADGFDVCAATLNVVKGLPMKVDVCSLTQNGKRTLSFMSQVVGLIADLDIGTDHLRWMGEARFTYGFLRGLIQFKACPVQLSYKSVQVDKDDMYAIYQKRRTETKANEATRKGLLEPATDETALPPLKYSTTDEDGWTVVDKPLLYVLGGKGPYLGRDFMAFPVSLPDDGLIDLIAQEVSARTEFLGAFGGDAANGGTFWKSSVNYVKASAYRVKPLSPKGAFAVDGEVFPFEEYQVEAHQGLATLLSPYGYYAAEVAGRPTKA
ncbi:ATP-NAD kinase-like domain-containing protein [Mycena metata]|uniref:ATP-NAD kinase-like domain-containing protein n=1 Tax=Mycena metata TaxID=1033252 RepID=A0AAD7NT70_9AGAR|nr:ATP-NAD kinase-like domain-containing protein [Mycena metata]